VYIYKMKSIPLSKGLFAIVDDGDFDELSKYKWSAGAIRNYPYAVRRPNGKTILMHRQIMGVFNPNLIVDHIDRNTLNNTRSNLRVTTKSMNARNKKASGTSKYMGVSLHRGKKWIAHIKINGKYKHLGVFSDEVEAAKAYNKAVLEANLQDFANLNIL
jgi:hypothetical protein